MTDSTKNQLALLADILLLQQNLRNAPTITELGYVLVNDTQKLISYRTSVLWLEYKNTGRVESVSGIPSPVAMAPFTRWIGQLCKELFKKGMKEPKVVSSDLLTSDLALKWNEFLPAHVLWLPLALPNGAIIGGLLLAKDSAWRAEEQALMNYWASTAAHAIESVLLRRRSWIDWLRAQKLKLWIVIIFILITFLWMPVSISVLAPAEVIPKNPIIIRAPIDGVINNIYVDPNQEATQGERLLDLDDTKLLAQLDVVGQELEIANAEYRQAEQASVTDRLASSEMPMLLARIEQREAEVAYTQSLLDRISIHAIQDGIAIFNDMQELVGKPVKIGEKIMTLASPTSAELEIWLAVGDSIPLPEKATIDLFLNVQPEKPLKAQLRYVNYQAEVSPEGILTFRARADFSSGSDLPRIGWRGTAKIYGKEVPLYYYLFRRPYAAVRQWLGL
ncbi:MAG: hypothetical protein ACI9XC_000240 [Gammaproteobacteria bacterium]